MWRDRAAVCALVVFAAAACFDAAVALDGVPLGPSPGDGPRGGAFVAAAILAAVVTTCVLAFFPSRLAAYALIPAAIGAWVVAQYYTYDPYDLPTKLRYSETASISAAWIYGLFVAGVLLAAVVRRWPRLGVLMLPFVLLCGGTVVGEGLH